MSKKIVCGKNLTRRSVVAAAWRGFAVAGLGGTLGDLAAVRAFGAAGGRRSLVCVDLIGGNDSNSMIVPLDAAAYSVYEASRGPLAIPQNTLLPVQSLLQGGMFGFHPNMASAQQLYGKGALAVLANSGPMDQPSTKAAFTAHQAQLPPKLFEHSGGDRLAYSFPAVPMPPWAFEYQEKDPEDPHPQTFQFGAVSVMSPNRAKVEYSALDAAVKGLRPLQTVFPNTFLGAQMSRVAKLLKVAPEHGLSSPTFSVTLPGFDTHRDALARQAPLLEILSDALYAFFEATHEIGMAHEVTTFTHTEFSRTLAPNRTLGTEHAWGGHQLIMGAAVRGGDIYGKFPSLALGGADDLGSVGILVPTTPSVHYHTALAKWYGVPESVLSAAMPAMNAFPSSELGFLN